MFVKFYFSVVMYLKELRTVVAGFLLGGLANPALALGRLLITSSVLQVSLGKVFYPTTSHGAGAVLCLEVGLTPGRWGKPEAQASRLSLKADLSNISVYFTCFYFFVVLCCRLVFIVHVHARLC